MRRLTGPLTLALAAAIVVMGVVGTLGRHDAAKARRQQAKAVGPSPAAVAANAEVLSGVVLPPGSRFADMTISPPTPKGHGAGTTVTYGNDLLDRAAIISHFKSQLTGWVLVREEVVPAHANATFRKGDAWLVVSATDVDLAGKTGRGFVVFVNALDAPTIAR